MEQEIPQELIELLDVVKLQNEKIFEMQEEQLLWNKQHASNLKTILEKLSDIYDTIKRFKDAKTSQTNQFNQMNQSPPSTIQKMSENSPQNVCQIQPQITTLNPNKTLDQSLKHSSSIPQSKPLTTPQMTIDKIKSSFQQQPSVFQLSLKKSAKIQQSSPFDIQNEKRMITEKESNELSNNNNLNNFNNLYQSTQQKDSKKRSQQLNNRNNQINRNHHINQMSKMNFPNTSLNQNIQMNENNTKKLEEILLTIETEEMFDELTSENIKRMIPCLVGIFVLGTDKNKVYVALQFLWEITRKHERIFRENGGCVHANQLMYGLKLLQNNSGYFRVEESPLTSDELQWVMNFLMKWMK